MRTIHTPMTSLNLSHLLNVKHWQYWHWNVLVMDICFVRINLEKFSADFWPVRRIGLSWNFKVLQWINLNERFSNYYNIMKIMWRDCKQNSFESFQRYTKKREKSKFWMKLHLDRWWVKGLAFKIVRTKFPSIEIWY